MLVYIVTIVHGMENVKLDTTGKQVDMKACYIRGRS